MDEGGELKVKERQGWTAIEEQDIEKRKSHRHECEQVIICKSYDHEKDDFDITPAVVYKKSRKSLLFFSDNLFQPDTPIHIQLKEDLPDRHENELNEGVHARVIWCEKIDNHDHLFSYKVGVEYFE